LDGVTGDDGGNGTAETHEQRRHVAVNDAKLAEECQKKNKNGYIRYERKHACHTGDDGFTNDTIKDFNKRHAVPPFKWTNVVQ